MTESQAKKMYWPAWGLAFRANWVRDRGTVRQVRDWADGSIGARVWAEGVAAARQLVRGVTADDLRHACHVVALGRQVSSSKLTNSELDRVMSIMRHLADPDDLDAVMDIEDPDRAARRRKEWWIANCGLPAGYVATVSAAKFGSADPSTLSMRDLTDLVRTLQMRLRARQARRDAAPAPTAPPAVDEPF